MLGRPPSGSGDRVRFLSVPIARQSHSVPYLSDTWETGINGREGPDNTERPIDGCVPAVLAPADDVPVSYVDRLQDLNRRQWSLERVHEDRAVGTR
ncbi:glutamate dehydrogenase [Natrinema altunense JCM 12890]|uniref:Glutamate dehydrogenase n=1 Tax=Natrinema altunense (strain JCM 12890 / CGMCC 1.3731 / AJ2) TaxID=1227494 RepID=M0A2I6_NATA2|nr:glutamate dehydrogenase [Natrinema altunense JCM 12890]